MKRVDLILKEIEVLSEEEQRLIMNKLLKSYRQKLFKDKHVPDTEEPDDKLCEELLLQLQLNKWYC